CYDGPTIYVPDASRAVGVAQNLMSEDTREAYIGKIADDYEKVRTRAQRRATPLVTLTEARANRMQTDWGSYVPPRPSFLGRRAYPAYDLAEIVQYIDWGPFFQTWDLHGPFPAILDDKVVGEEARRVFAEAQDMLRRIVDEGWL